jgi:Lrp/AsnC family transcriptional regulator, leucine-responsive regulatory protein
MGTPLLPDNAPMKPPEDLDGYDKNILRQLSANGRMSWRDLCDTISLSLTPTLRRVRRLESTGYITGYAATLDEQRLLGAVSSYASIGLDRQSEEALVAFETQVKGIKEIVAWSQVTGNVDYMLEIRAKDLTHYQTIIARISQIPHVAHVHSNFVLKTVEKAIADIL